MESSDTNQRFKRTEDVKTILKIVSQRLLHRELLARHPHAGERKCEFVKVYDDTVAVHFFNWIPPQRPFTVSGVMEDYYTEVELSITSHVSEDIYLCRTNYLRISSQRRMEPRFTITDPDMIYLTRIRISKNALEIRGDTLPMTYRVLLDKFRTERGYLGREVEIRGFEKTGEIHGEVRRTGKAVFVADVRKGESFHPAATAPDDFLDVKKFYGDRFIQFRNQMMARERVGWILCPVKVPDGGADIHPIAYIEVFEREPVTMEKFMEVKALSCEIIESLQDLTYLEVMERQQVLDVSQCGLRFATRNEKLIEALAGESRMLCDIVMIHQAPVTIMGEVRSISRAEDQTVHAGFKINGNDDRSDLKRYYDFIHALEKNRKQSPRS